MGIASSVAAGLIVIFSHNHAELAAKFMNASSGSPDYRSVKMWGRYAAPALKAKLSQPSSYRMYAYARALAELGDSEAADIFLKLLMSSDVDSQAAGLYGLGVLRDQRVVPFAIRMLEEGKLEDCAIEALGNCQAMDAVPLIVPRMGQSISAPWAVDSISMALGRYGKGVVPELRAALESEDKWRRQHAAVALRFIPDSGLFEKLIYLAENDPDNWVRSEAFKAACATKDPRLLPFALKYAENGLYQPDSIIAVATMGGEKYISKLEAWLWKREYGAAEALVLLGTKRARQVLEKALLASEPGKDIDSDITIAIASHPDRRYVPMLLKAIQRHREDPWSMETAICDLGPSILPEIQVLMDSKDPKVRLRAAAILANLNNVASIPHLSKLVNDSDSEVRLVARDSLARFIFGTRRWPEDWFSRKL